MKIIGAIKAGMTDFVRSVSKALLVFLALFSYVLMVLAFDFVSDIYNGWKTTHQSPAGHLKLAREICEVNKSGNVFCVAHTEAAIEQWKQIPTNAPEYKEAAGLLPLLQAHAQKEAEQEEAERKAREALKARAEAEKLRLATQTQDESLAQLLRNIRGEAHDPFICAGTIARGQLSLSFDDGHYWWVDDGRCAKQEEEKQRIRERTEIEQRQQQQRRRDQEAMLSSYWPTTLRVDTDMDSFWLNKEERTCQTIPDEKGRVSASPVRQNRTNNTIYQ